MAVIDPLRNNNLFSPLAHDVRTVAETAPKNPNESPQDYAQRRHALQLLVARIKELDVQIHTALLQVDGAQAYMRLMVPQEVLGQALNSATLLGEMNAYDDGGAHGEAFLHDVQVYNKMVGVRQALAQLAANNRRFGMVLDLMVAALHLLEPATHDLAGTFLGLHVSKCQQILADVHATLGDFPRLQGYLFKTPRLS